MAPIDAGQCSALNVSDERRCQETATSLNGLFCAFHSKQCQGLYRGYKKRNAQLDRLSASPPKYLANSKIPLANQLFTDIDTEDVCQEIHDHLFHKLQLLERVIRARKLHHSRFFSMNYDYGHEKFLNQLQNERVTVTRALERIERRTAEILYTKQKWFKWVRQCQDHEEAHREKEQKRIKQEAALFKRHWKEVQQRMKELRAKEDQKKQDAFLEEALKKRLAEQEVEEDDANWDPIEDVLEDNRGNYIDLIKHFLWMEGPEDVATEQKDKTDDPGQGNSEGEDYHEKISEHDLSNGAKENTTENLESVRDNEIDNLNEEQNHASSKSSKTSKKKKRAKKTNENQKILSADSTPSAASTGAAPNGGERLALSESSKISKTKKKAGGQTSSQDIDKGIIETREEMYDRLKNGSEYLDDEIVGPRVVGTVENPVMETKTITFPDKEIEILLAEIAEIKHLLFCRLLLGHAALLPAALRAESIEAFLDDPEVTESALRDLCLKMERPGLQEIRDACADLFRSANEEEELEIAEEEDSNKDANDDLVDELDKMVLKPEKPRGALPEKWISKREKAKEKLTGKPTLDQLLDNDEGTAVDFGEIRDDGKFHKKMIRVNICGRTIWNYPSSRAMNRKGWLHYCIIAKDSSLYDALELCRHWDEFFELNILAIWRYFPGSRWSNWVGNRWRQQMLQLGFIMYFESSDPDASVLTQYHQTARRGQHRRSHAVFEARNFMCAHVKRDDQVSRRLIQYLSMHSHELLVLVRDAEDGRLLIKPPEEERWLIREKSGLGRATKNQWNVIRSIGPKFFEEMDRYRKWNFGFKGFYDVYVWDLEAGEPFPVLYNAVQRLLFKAHRCCSGADLYNMAAPVLKTLYREENTQRVRDILPGDDGIRSIYDDIHHEETNFLYSEVEISAGNIVKQRIPEPSKIPRNLFYNQADALEDEILFPEERSSDGTQQIAVGKIEPLRKWEEEGFSVRKFVEGSYLESDFSESDYDSSFDLDSEDEESDEVHDRSGENDQSLDATDNALQPATVLPDILKEMLDKALSDAAKTKPEKKDLYPTKDEFMEFLDWEKARIFKEVWHKADLEPEAQLHYTEMKEMTKKSRAFIQDDRDFHDPRTILAFSLIKWLDTTQSRGDCKDIWKAVALLSVFFYPDFLESNEGAKFKDSLLFRQDERAKHPPDVRSSVGNQRRRKEFWKEWDDVKENIKCLEDIPQEWDVAIRPIIARLYKAGVIRTQSGDFYAGQAIAVKEPHRATRDLFFDFRPSISEIHMNPIMQDPTTIPALRGTAHDFSLKHPNARFAILRLWSAPHFYPLMIGFDNRDGTSFQDLVGRKFIWMFVPKDMPFSDWSMHHAARLRILDFMEQLAGRVVVKRNAYLVMGTDEQDLLKLAAATAFAIQRRPWRWEVDLWKSFVNVDYQFLEALDDVWLE